MNTLNISKKISDEIKIEAIRNVSISLRNSINKIERETGKKFPERTPNLSETSCLDFRDALFDSDIGMHGEKGWKNSFEKEYFQTIKEMVTQEVKHIITMQTKRKIFPYRNVLRKIFLP